MDLLTSLTKKIKIGTGVFLAIFFAIIFSSILNSAPFNFPTNKLIEIKTGETFNEISQSFKSQNLIRSPLLFESLAWLMKKETKVKAGEYFFEKKIGAWKMVKTITSDNYLNNLIKITIPEGYDLRDIASFFENKGMWQAEELWQITGLPATKGSMEGYLFPDTYFIPTNISPSSMVKIMRDNFDNKTTPGMRKKDIITMASLLEKEAATKKDRKLISGILWKRLDVGMPLQVDAIFPYIIGKHSLQLTLEDLRVDSLYNTYLYKGLPSGPITNPGLLSIKSAMEPTESDYWYYLSDKQGNMYYSVTYDEHLAKKSKYLK